MDILNDKFIQTIIEKRIIQCSTLTVSYAYY